MRYKLKGPESLKKSADFSYLPKSIGRSERNTTALVLHNTMLIMKY